MRKDLLEVLHCPSCFGKNLSVISTGENGTEIRDGTIECNSCKKSYPIKDGISNLLINITPEIASEQKGWTELEKAVVNTDELMLSLPDGIGEHRAAWKSQAENFHHMFSKLELDGKETVLDLGAGRCWSTSFFAERGCYAVGIDILLTKYVGLLTGDVFIKNKNIYFERIAGDMNTLPFRDRVFDIVFITATLHHSLDLHATLKEVSRVLRPGGKMVLINEPVVGMFKKTTLDCVEVKAGINEHVHKLWNYLRNIKKAGLEYRIYEYIGCCCRPVNLLKQFFSVALRKKSLYKRTDRMFNYLQLLFFGGILNIIACKKA
ncbi:MAG: methyltransferase domain-containing protein [Actinobacteria bacterium]|nr:methyltransferase domain-containing protein [Actinomycetota bacterium]